jgi:hypothetical protein
VSNLIVKLDGHYLIWSTNSDRPITRGMTAKKVREWVMADAMERAARDLDDSMARVEVKGTSAFNDEDVDATIYLNRAGEGESHISKREIVRRYCDGKAGGR